MKRTTNLLAAATRPAVPALDLTKHGKCPFTVDAVQQTAAAAAALKVPTFTEGHLDERVPLLYGRKNDGVRVTYDPTQISRQNAWELFSEADSVYPDARAVAFTDIGCTVLTDIPADELPVRIDPDVKGHFVIAYDDTRISTDDMLELLTTVRVAA